MSDTTSGDAALATSLTACAAALRGPVRAVLRARADTMRLTLPPRPTTAAGRYAWWKALDSGQSRQAMLIDHLDTLCAHLAGRPALGYDQNDPLPEAALEAADGFASEATAQDITNYRRSQRKHRLHLLLHNDGTAYGRARSAMNPREPQDDAAEDGAGRPCIYDPLPVYRRLGGGEVWAAVVSDSGLIVARDECSSVGSDLS